MLYLTHVPARALRDCVEYLWLLSDAPSHGKELIVNMKRLEGAGVPFRNEVEAGPGGKQIQIEDPDGNPIELHQQ